MSEAGYETTEARGRRTTAWRPAPARNSPPAQMLYQSQARPRALAHFMASYCQKTLSGRPQGPVGWTGNGLGLRRERGAVKMQPPYPQPPYPPKPHPPQPYLDRNRTEPGSRRGRHRVHRRRLARHRYQ